MSLLRKSRSALALAGFGLATAGAAWFGSHYSPAKGRSREWYRELDKPIFTPPDAVFPIVWTSLYAMMAWSGWRVWSAPPSDESFPGAAPVVHPAFHQREVVQAVLWEAAPGSGADRSADAGSFCAGIHRGCAQRRPGCFASFRPVCRLGRVRRIAERGNSPAKSGLRRSRGMKAVAVFDRCLKPPATRSVVK